MNSKQVIFTGNKESYVVRVLIKKVRDAGIGCDFVPCRVNDLSSAIKEGIPVVLWLDDEEKPKDDVIHYLIDSLEEREGQLILIGDRDDLSYVCSIVPEELIFRAFPRPVNNQEFTDTMVDFFAKAESGEFKKRILIVDDDTQYLALVREWLKGTYKVSMANSGLQAIKYLGKNKVDLILLDHEMPVTSGPQVLEMLRNDEDTRNIPVMFLTGKSDRQSVMSVVALKPEGYFLKTIQKEELLEKLKEFFILRMAQV